MINAGAVAGCSVAAGSVRDEPGRTAIVKLGGRSLFLGPAQPKPIAVQPQLAWRLTAVEKSQRVAATDRDSSRRRQLEP
mgnify:CR=1 FL=1